MKFKRGVSSMMTAIAVIVTAVIVGAGVYAVSSSASAKTVTSTSTAMETGTGMTVTSTSVSTATSVELSTTTATSTVTSAVTGTVAGTPEDLEAACAAEGNTVTLYDSFTTTANGIVATDWKAAFPQITLDAVPGLTSSEVQSESLTQFQAGHVEADAISNGVASLMTLNASGVLQSWNNYQEQLSGYGAGYTIAPGLIHPSTEDVDLLAYNTKTVTNTASLPTTWQGLTNSAWSGKIAIDNPTLETVTGEYFATLEPSMGNSSWTSLMKGIEANSPILTTAASASLTDLESGQASIAVVLLSAFNTAVANGEPVAVVPGFAGQAHVTGISLATDAPQPACGELLIQWWTSFAGQEMIVQTGRGAALPSVRALNATQVLGSLPSSTTIDPPSDVPSSYFTDATGWAGYYNTIFGGLG